MRIGLHIRFMFAFVLIAVGLTGGAMWLFQQQIEDTFRADFESRKQSIKATVSQRLQYTQEELLDEMAGYQSNARVLEIARAIEEGQFYSSERRPAQAIQTVHQLFVANPDLSVLFLVDRKDKKGEVVAAGHTDRMRMPMPEILRWYREAPKRVRVFEESFDSRGAEEVPEKAKLILGVIIPVERSILIVGGQALDRGWLGRMVEGMGDETSLALLADTGIHLASDENVTEGSEDFEAESFYALGLSFRLFVSRTRLDEQIMKMRYGMAKVGFAAVVLALFLGWWMARRLAYPIKALADATREVAEGDVIKVLPHDRRRDELGELIRSFNAMTLQITETRERAIRAERVAAWRDIAKQVAHEIKNPLFPIQTSIETLRKVHDRGHPDFEEIFEESTTTILEEVRRMERIVSAFSNFARMPKPTLIPCDLNKICQQVVHLHRSVDETIRMEMDLESNLPPVNADGEQMTQVMTNLVKNAIEAQEEGVGGCIRVWTRQRGLAVEIGVDDDGPGVPSDQREEVFAPHFTGKEDGAGLGLAIVLRIVTEHDGHIEIQDASSGGASFRITLPI